jgi:hypothetical protein
MSFDSTKPVTEKCDRCGRLVVDASTDFGNGLVLRPTCQGLKVVMNGERELYLSVSELRDFLERAYGA